MRNTVFRLLFGVIVFFLTVIGLEAFGTQGGSDTTREMAMASLPVISIQAGKREMNELHGYCSERDLAFIRPPLTPVGEDRGVHFLIHAYGTPISSASFEVRALSDGHLVENSPAKWEQMLQPEDDSTPLVQELAVTLKDLILPGEEYMLILMLDLADGRTARYYTRILRTDDSREDAIEFAERFHEGTFTKSEELKKYIEPDVTGDNTTFTNVDIHCSFDQITWGDLGVSPCSGVGISLHEISGNSVTLSMDYYVSGEEALPDEEEAGPARYHCREYYRLRRGSDRCYLISYERKMQEELNPGTGLYGDDLLSLGISDPDMSYVQSSGGAFAFVTDGKLYACSPRDNTFSYVFGFSEPGSTDRRELFDEHDIRILRVDEAGNVDFAVYGYMNRGDHEGEAGTAVYSYNSVYRTIEERAFVPYPGSYEFLKLRISQLSYMNGRDQYHFLQDNAMYTLNVESRSIRQAEGNLTASDFCTSSDGRMAAWTTADSAQKEITVADLATSARRSIEAPAGERVIPIGFLQQDFAYGLVRESEIETDALGGEFLPIYAVVIVGNTQEVLEHYEMSGFYITSFEAEESRIVLHRMQKEIAADGSAGYVQAEDDQIVSAYAGQTPDRHLRTLSIEKFETIIEIDAVGLDGDKVRYIRPKEMLSEGSREVVLPDVSSDDVPSFVVYGLQGAEEITDSIAQAVRSAKELSGVVVGGNGRVIWSSELLLDRNQIMAMSDSSQVEQAQGQAAMAECLRQILMFETGATSFTGMEEPDVPAVLSRYIESAKVYNLTGCSMRDALYFVSAEKPVIAMRSEDDPVLMIGYNNEIIVISDPAAGAVHSVNRKEFEKTLERAGNRFLTYSAST